MGKPHKHAELIKAWADGAEIEYRLKASQKWVPVDDTPRWCPENEYRVKPTKRDPVRVYFEAAYPKNPYIEPSNLYRKSDYLQGLKAVIEAYKRGELDESAFCD